MDFAHDIVLVSNTGGTLSMVSMKLGLRIGSEKTKAMIVGEHQAIPLTAEQKDIEYVDKFQYVGSYMSRTGDVDTDIHARIGKASAVFRRLRNVWRCSSICMDTKLYACTLQSSYLLLYLVEVLDIYLATKFDRTTMLINIIYSRCIKQWDRSWLHHTHGVRVITNS